MRNIVIATLVTLILGVLTASAAPNGGRTFAEKRSQIEQDVVMQLTRLQTMQGVPGATMQLKRLRKLRDCIHKAEHDSDIKSCHAAAK